MLLVRECPVKRCKSTDIALTRTNKMSDGFCEETYHCNNCATTFFIETKLTEVWSTEEYWGKDIYPIIFDHEENTNFHKAIHEINNIIDKKNQSVRVVIELLVLESFGDKHYSERSTEILAPLREKHKFA